MELELNVSKTLAEERLSLAEETLLLEEISVKDLDITGVSLSSILYALISFVRSGLPARSMPNLPKRYRPRRRRNRLRRT